MTRNSIQSVSKRYHHQQTQTFCRGGGQTQKAPSQKEINESSHCEKSPHKEKKSSHTEKKVSHNERIVPLYIEKILVSFFGWARC